MKASELRIGNLLEFSNNITPSEIITVGRRFFSSASIEREDGDFDITPYYKPIPITIEWLELFGFTPDSHKLVYDHPSPEVPEDEHKDLGKNFPAFFFNKRPEVNSWMDCHTRVTVTYVHQLQNLYHALTGEELKYNP